MIPQRTLGPYSVSAVGMGSKLISKKVMDYEAYDTIEKETKRVSLVACKRRFCKNR